MIKYKCSFCKKIYKSKGGLSTHIIWCKKNPNIKKQNEIRKKFNKQRDTFKGKCIYCKKEFFNQGLITHEIWCKKNLNPNLKKQNKIKKLMLEHYIDRSGDKNPFFGKQHSEKTKKLISIEKIKFHKEHPDFQRGNKNSNRAVVYAPYGPNFYNPTLRQAKWELQSGRCLLSGNKLNPYKTHTYHHFDWDKSNDNPDNHGFVTPHFHGIVHTKRKKEY